MNIGKYKALFERQRNYFSVLQFLILIYLFVDRAGWNNLYLLILPALFLLAWWDAKYVLPKEQEYLQLKSPVFQKLLENTRIAEFKKILKNGTDSARDFYKKERVVKIDKLEVADDYDDDD